MKRLLTVLVAMAAAVGLATPAVGQPAMPTAKKYTSCDKLLKDYPNGVAKNAATARKAVAAGFAQPKVNTALYRTNGARLDRDKDGVMCEQEGTAAADPATSVYWIPTSIPLLDAFMQANIEVKKWNQAQSNYMWAVASTFQKNPFLYCPLFKTEAGKAQIMAGLVSDAQLAQSKLDASYVPWVNEIAPLVIGITCARYGLATS